MMLRLRVIALVSFFVVLGSCSRTEAQKPIRILPSPTVDFGKIKAEAKSIEAPTAVELTNEGTREVKITGMRVGCVCLRVRLSRTAIPPGGKVRVEFTLIPPLPPGPSSYKALIHTDCSAQPLIGLEARCYYLAPWEAVPASVAVTITNSKEHVNRIVTVRGCPGDTEFTLHAATSASKSVVVDGWKKRDRTVNDCVLWDVSLTADPMGPISEDARIVVKAGSGGEMAEKSVPVKVTRAFNYAATPHSQTIITDIGNTQPRWYPITISGEKGVPLSFSSISTPESLEARVCSTDSDQQTSMRIELRAKPGLAGGFHAGKVLIRLDNEVGVLEIPVVVWVK